MQMFARPGVPGNQVARSVSSVGAVDIAAGVLLSAVVFVLVHVHLFQSDPHGDIWAGLLATTMTLPVVVARRWPDI